MKILDLKVAGLWSFDQSGISVNAFSDNVTVIIGKNNSGKSNIRKALCWFIDTPNWLTGKNIPIVNDIDAHQTDTGQSIESGRIQISVAFNKSECDKILSCDPVKLDPDWRAIIEIGLQSYVRIGYSSTWSSETSERKKILIGPQKDWRYFPSAEKAPDKIQNDWNRIHAKITQGIHYYITRNIKPILAHRTVDTAFIEYLRVRRTPEPNQRKLKVQFRKIESLFKRMTGIDDATIEPLHDGKKIHIDTKNKYLDLSAYGDGIHQLLFLSKNIATANGQVFIIEEPETFLHPEKQRELLDLLQKSIDNQFIITTHSPVLLDSGKCGAIYRTDYNGQSTSIEKCESTTDTYAALDSIGARASDILQANFVIWVEGPTDRMFLNRCFELMECQFSEGIDYQIAYYGGSVRSHVGFDGDPPLINLLSLSRNVAMICDSDKSEETGEVNAAKQRLKVECEKNKGFYWTTAGREIENYIPSSVITTTYKELLEDESISIELGQYDRIDDVINEMVPEPDNQKWRTNYKKHKARIMPEFLKHLTTEGLDEHDLKKRLAELIEKIKQANSPHD